MHPEREDESTAQDLYRALENHIRKPDFRKLLYLVCI